MFPSVQTPLVCTSLLLSSLVAFSNAAISQRTLDDMQYYSQWAAAAYCDVNTNPSSITAGQTIACPSGNSCPLVQANKATYLSSIYNYGPYDLAAVLGHDSARNALVLSFRGAEGLGVLSTEPDNITPCAVLCSTCACWTGLYLNAWVSLRDEVVSMLRTAVKQYPHAQLVVTGHSLGAIEAAYAAGELRANGTILDASRILLYSYGQPRTGNEDAAAALTAQGNNFRVTHTDDPAPRMGDTSSGFRHLSPEYWINPDRNPTTYTVSTSDVQVIEGYNSVQGNGGTGGYDAPAHVEYFQAEIGSCYTNISRVAGLPYYLGGDQGGIINGTTSL